MRAGGRIFETGCVLHIPKGRSFGFQPWDWEEECCIIPHMAIFFVGAARLQQVLVGNAW